MKIIRGNFNVVSARVFANLKLEAAARDKFISDGLVAHPYEVTREQIFKDLTRSRFLNFNDKTQDDLISDWVNSKTTNFTQGSISANIFSFIMHVHFTSLINGADENESAAALESYSCIKNVDFSYYDDDKIPCGFSITYNTKDPSLWLVSQIRNTTAVAEEREVQIIASDSLLDVEGDHLEESNFRSMIKEFLNCIEANKLLENDITELNQEEESVVAGDIFVDNKANIAKLGAIGKYIEVNGPVKQSEKFLAKKTRFEKLVELKATAITEAEVQNRQQLDELDDEYTPRFQEIDESRTALNGEITSLETETDGLRASLKDLDTQASQPFTRRHPVSLTVGLLSSALLIGILVVLFPPVGIPLAAGLTATLVAIGAVLFAVGVAAASKIAADEGKLDGYKEQRPTINNELEDKNSQLAEKKTRLSELQQSRKTLATEKQEKIDAIKNNESYKATVAAIEKQFEEDCKIAMEEDEVAPGLILRDDSDNDEDSDCAKQLAESLSDIEDNLKASERELKDAAASPSLAKSCDALLLQPSETVKVKQQETQKEKDNTLDLSQ